MEKQNVVYFIDSMNTGGAENVVKNYILHLDKEKFNSKLICISDRMNTVYEDELEKNNCNVIYLGELINLKINFLPDTLKMFIIYFLKVKLINKLLKKFQPDIIHMHLSTPKIIRFVNNNYYKDKKIFYTCHTDPERLFKIKRRISLYKSLKYFISKYNMVLIALNKEMACNLNKTFNISNSLYLYNGIDMNKFKYSEEIRISKRKELNILDNDFVLGNVGRFHPVKNHKLMLEIFRKIYKNNSNSKLILVGSGFGKKEIKEYLKNNNLEKAVIILENRLDVNEIMNTMDVYIVTSKSEGLNISFLEAQAIGLKCVISNKVPKEAIFGNKVKVNLLESSLEQWINSVRCDENYLKPISKKDDFNFLNIIKILENIYLE